MPRRPRNEPVIEPTLTESDPTPDEVIDGGGDPGDEDPPEPEADPVKALKEQMDQMQRTHMEEMAALRRTIPPVEPKEKPEPAAKTSYKDLIFTDPDEAVRKIQEDAVRMAKEEITAAYQKDQGTQRFWNNFYRANKDFSREEDHDLVELTLNSNLKDLANIPVDQAMKKLADLTRDRMLRYSGGTKRNGRRPFTEGGGPPSRRQAAPEEAEVTSLSEIIKRRAAARRKATAA